MGLRRCVEKRPGRDVRRELFDDQVSSRKCHEVVDKAMQTFGAMAWPKKMPLHAMASMRAGIRSARPQRSASRGVGVARRCGPSRRPARRLIGKAYAPQMGQKYSKRQPGSGVAASGQAHRVSEFVGLWRHYPQPNPTPILARQCFAGRGICHVAAVRRYVFAYSSWDIVPVLAALAHAAYIVLLYFAFVRAPVRVRADGIDLAVVDFLEHQRHRSHHIHNFYFRWQPLNRAFSMLLSLSMGFRKPIITMCTCAIMSAQFRPTRSDGKTLDPLSIYRCGHDGKLTRLALYFLELFFATAPRNLWRSGQCQAPRADIVWGRIRTGCVVSMAAAVAWLNWRSCCA